MKAIEKHEWVDGDIRRRKKFCWFPLYYRVNADTVHRYWWEWVTITERYNVYLSAYWERLQVEPYQEGTPLGLIENIPRQRRWGPPPPVRVPGPPATAPIDPFLQNPDAHDDRDSLAADDDLPPRDPQDFEEPRPRSPRTF